MSEDFDLGFTPDNLADVKGNAGVGFERPKPGDYKLKIVDSEIKVSQGKSPHNMYKPTFEIVEAYSAENKDCIGMKVDGLYGTASSPPFMKQRMKCLLDACKVVPKGPLKSSHLNSKTFDASIVWELSKSDKLDEMGQPKMYVNARVKAERPIGTARVKNFDPLRESQKAIKYLDGDDVGAETAGGATDKAPWEAEGEVETPSNGVSETTSSFMKEEEVPADAHEYRARYKLGLDAENMKKELIENGIDPEGEIKLEHVDAEIAEKYKAKFGGGAKGPKKLGKLGK